MNGFSCTERLHRKMVAALRKHGNLTINQLRTLTGHTYDEINYILYPGTTGETVFTTAVVDGTVRWKFISSTSLTWIRQDSFGYSLVIDKAACLNGARGFAQTDTVNSGRVS